MMGPASTGVKAFTRLRNIRKGVGRTTTKGDRAGVNGDGQYWSHFTLDLSSNLVNMTIIGQFCSKIMSQKSPNVSGNGPCVATYAFGLR
uniref:Uncharacterized protein n=1 Tax=Romanomermis culicivorax TaxID=13658 RepID=A0A915JTJ5_ROMCU